MLTEMLWSPALKLIVSFSPKAETLVGFQRPAAGVGDGEWGQADRV
jgi:hypothetical protein